MKDSRFHYCDNGNPHNYPPNAVVWPVGSLVLHDADAKESRMLMRVVGLPDGGGVVEVEYVDAERQKSARRRIGRKRRMAFPLTQLHDPARFGVVAERREA